MLGMTRTGPIGLDFGTDNLKIVQADFVKGSPVIRSAVTLSYPTEKSDLFESPADLKKLISEARKQGVFQGSHSVVSMPPEKVQFVSLEYKCASGQEPDVAVVEAIKERFGDQLRNSVIDFLHIRPEHRDQPDRTALVALAEKKTVVSFLEFLHKAGLIVDRLEIGPVAINRLVSAMNPAERDKIVLAINFGLQKSYATVLWGRRLLLDRELSFGLDTGVQQLSMALEVSEQEASQLLSRHGIQAASKVMANLDYAEPSVEEAITDILQPSLQQLSNEIKRLMLYVASRTRGRSVYEAYILGSISGWPGIDMVLSEMTGMPLKKTEPFYGLATSKQAAKIENPSSLRGIAVATGLSLSGFEDKRGNKTDA